MLPLFITTIVMQVILAISVYYIVRGFLAESDTRIKAIGGCITAVAVLIAIGVYGAIGSYGLPDAPLSGREDEIRLAQAEGAAGHAAAAENLVRARAAAEARPGDIALRLALAEAASATGDFALEIETLKTVLALSEGAAGSHTAAVKSLIAEALSREAGGLVTGRALGWLESALADDPGDIRARYLRGLYFSQSGDDETALSHWAPLARDVTGTEIAPSVVRAINAAATRLGVDAADYLPGDSGVSDADIGVMVASLEDRLLAQDHVIDHEDWEMLIRSHAVLGNTVIRDTRIRDLLERMQEPSTDPASDSRLLMAVVQIVLPADNLPATIPPVVAPLLERARALTPESSAVLFFSGLVAHHGGDAAGVRKYWEPLAARLEEGNSLRAAIEKELEGAGQ